jgi:uncharacterized LabA/DUF88 family protein
MKNKKTIALFIDNENLRKCLKSDFDVDFYESYICDYLLENFGDIVLGRSYWAFGRDGSDRNISGQKAFVLFKLGIEVALVPTFDAGGIGKNITDGKMIIDIVHYLDRYPTIDTWVLVSNDKDFLPVLEELRRRGKEVLLIHSQDVEILRITCERLGIQRSLYQDLIPHQTKS